MTTSPVSESIVVAVDDASATDDAIRWAADEAQLHGRPLLLAHAVEPMMVDNHDPILRARIQRWRMHSGKHLLAETKTRLVDEASLDPALISTALRLTHPVHALTELSRDASMVVVGSRFHGSLGGRRLGSVSAGLCYRAHCPVAVVHHYDPLRAANPVVVGIDGSSTSERAAAVGFEEASRRHVALIAVHAWSDVDVLQLLGADWNDYSKQAETTLHAQLANLRAQYPGVPVQEKIFCDRPAHWLLREAERASLVVVGSHGRGEFETLITGSVATAVAERADVPVIVVREPRAR